MDFHQAIVVISSACFVVGGLLLGLAFNMSALKQTREHLHRLERFAVSVDRP